MDASAIRKSIHVVMIIFEQLARSKYLSLSKLRSQHHGQHLQPLAMYFKLLYYISIKGP